MKTLVSIPLVVLAVVAAILAFAAPRRPPPLPAIEWVNDRLAGALADLPPIETLAVAGAAPIAWRVYEGEPGRGWILLVHGSSGHSVVVHLLARALRAAGFTVWSIDLRGHGASGPLGDIDRVGRLEDDVAALLDEAERRRPGERRLMIGHSLGGGFALRIAAGPLANRFDAHLALAPFVAADFPGTRPGSGGWADVSLARIVLLTVFDRFGLTAFDHLPVIAFAVPDDAIPPRTPFYSHRLLENASFPRDWKQALRRIERPTRVMIGAGDELFDAVLYRRAFADAAPAIAVDLRPNATHMGLIVDDGAVAAVVATAGRMLAR